MTTDLTKGHYLKDEDVYLTPRGRSNFVALRHKFVNKDRRGKMVNGNPTHSLQWNVWVKGMRKTLFAPMASNEFKPGTIFSPRFCLE